MANKKKEEIQEVLLEELRLHAIEYTSVREEIRLWHNVIRRYHQLSLAAIVGGLGASPFIVQWEAQSIFLLFPFILYLIIFQIRFSNSVVESCAKYLFKKLTPRVNEILDQHRPPKESVRVLGFQDFWFTTDHRPIFRNTPHDIPIFGVIIFLFIYLFINDFRYLAITLQDTILIGLHLMVLIIMAVKQAIYFVKKRKRIKQLSYSD